MDVLGRAIDLKRKGKLREAESLLRREIQLYLDAEGRLPAPTEGGHRQALSLAVSLGDTLTRLGDIAEAEDLADQVLSHSPLDRRALIVKGNVRLAQERYAQAVEYLEAAVQAKSDDYSVSRLALALYRSEDAGALERLSREQGAKHPQVFTFLGLLAEKEEGGDAKATEYYERVLGLDSENSYAYSRILKIRAGDRPEEEVTRDLDQIIRVRGNDPQILATRAQNHRKSGNFRQAAEDYRKAARLDPENPFFWAQAGFALIRARDRPEAIPLLEESLRLDPADHMVGKALVRSYRETRQIQRGTDFLESLVASTGQKKLYGLIKLLSRDQGEDEGSA